MGSALLSQEDHTQFADRDFLQTMGFDGDSCLYSILFGAMLGPDRILRFLFPSTLRSTLASRINETRRTLTLASLSRKELLIVRAIGDEASFTLASTYFFSWIIAKIGKLIDLAAQAADTLHRVGANLTVYWRVGIGAVLVPSGIALMITVFKNIDYILSAGAGLPDVIGVTLALA